MRREFVIGIGAVLAAVLTLAYFFCPNRSADRQTPSVAIPEQAPAVQVTFSELVHGSKSTVTDRVNYFITSKEELDQLWKMINATSTVPSIDFDTQAVIAVFAGQQLVAGTNIAVAKIEDAAKRLVSITISRPEGTCAAKHSTTTPYEVIRVARTALSLTHEDTPITAVCP